MKEPTVKADALKKAWKYATIIKSKKTTKGRARTLILLGYKPKVE